MCLVCLIADIEQNKVEEIKKYLYVDMTDNVC